MKKGRIIKKARKKNKYHHVAVEFDGSRDLLTVYVNGDAWVKRKKK